MAMVMGADSLNPINTRLTNGYTLFDWAMRMKDIPEFWGRPLTGVNRIEPEEIEFYREKRCKIALMVDDLTENEVSAFDGTAAARRAVDRAEELGVPQNEGIALFACIHEEWAVNHNWMMGFARVLRDNGYVPGFIGNTDSSKNFNFDRQCGHYEQATQEVGGYGAVY